MLGRKKRQKWDKSLVIHYTKGEYKKGSRNPEGGRKCGFLSPFRQKSALTAR